MIYFANGTPLHEPALFCLGWPQVSPPVATQPRHHQAPLIALRSVSVGCEASAALSPALTAARDAGLLCVHHSERPELRLGFQASQAVRYDLRESLGLLLVGKVLNA